METFHGTTIVTVRRAGKVVVGGDGQVTLGNTVMKGNATKVRKIYGDKVIVGFAGATADAFTLLERFEAMLERHSGLLKRSAVELAKDWRTDKILRRLEAFLIAVDENSSLLLSGSGDVIEPDGSGRADCTVWGVDPGLFDEIEDVDADHFPCGHEALCEEEVVIARRWVAARVVVREHDAGRDPARTLHHQHRAAWHRRWRAGRRCPPGGRPPVAPRPPRRHR